VRGRAYKKEGNSIGTKINSINIERKCKAIRRTNYADKDITATIATAHLFFSKQHLDPTTSRIYPIFSNLCNFVNNQNTKMSQNRSLKVSEHSKTLAHAVLTTTGLWFIPSTD